MESAIVTGVGPGLGRALAEALARDGLAVALVARRRAVLDEVAGAIAAQGGRALPLALDAADLPTLSEACRHVATTLGPPVMAVHNAAALHGGAALETSAEDLVADFRINVAAGLALAQAVAPAMRAARRGTILFTGGGFATRPAAGWASLGLGKAGVRHLGASLAQELAPDGVTIGSVTIQGAVGSTAEFLPSRIAADYLAIHRGAIRLRGPFFEHIVGAAPAVAA